MNKVKQVRYYVDLFPGWQRQPCKPYLISECSYPKAEGSQRFEIVVSLPVIDDIDGVLEADVPKEVI